MQTHGVSFAASTVLSTASISQPNPSPSAVQRSFGKARWQSKHRKTDISRFLDLTTEDEDEDEDEDEEDGDFGNVKEDKGKDIGEAQGSVRHPIFPGPSGKESFNWAISSMMTRYNQKSQPQDVQTWSSLQIPEGAPIPPRNKLFIVDLFSGVFTSCERFNQFNF